MPFGSSRIIHRAAILAAILALASAAPVKSQESSWQLVGGVGGVTGQSLAHSAVFVGALGRDIMSLSGLRLGAELSAGHLPTGHLGCPESASAGTCDLRELHYFGALSIVGAVSAPTRILTPYARANLGGWIGRGTDVTGERLVRETGLTIAGEGGVRVRHVAAGLRVDQLNGAPRGPLRVASIVVRVSLY